MPVCTSITRNFFFLSQNSSVSRTLSAFRRILPHQLVYWSSSFLSYQVGGAYAERVTQCLCTPPTISLSCLQPIRNPLIVPSLSVERTSSSHDTVSRLGEQRSPNLQIKSLLLCQLSYGAMRVSTLRHQCTGRYYEAYKQSTFIGFVAMRGLEPPRPESSAPRAGVSTSSTTLRWPTEVSPFLFHAVGTSRLPAARYRKLVVHPY